jgi:cytidylate kinase
MTVIAMTREIGSLSTDVAAGLAARLGLRIIRFEDVADRVARRLGVDPDALLRYFEGSASFLERWKIDRRKLLGYTAEEVLHHAQRGNVLIKGWGTATLLRNVPGVISIRICAPMAFRVRVMMDRLGTTDESAVQARIEREDEARARTMLAYFGIEEEDARLHHLVLNTARLSVETCVTAVAALADIRRFNETARTRSALADKLVEVKINSAFVERIGPSMAPLGVQVSVDGGKITLAGTSCSGSLRRRAERIARMVAGACSIDNRIVSVPSRGRLYAEQES